MIKQTIKQNEHQICIDKIFIYGQKRCILSLKSNEFTDNQLQILG